MMIMLESNALARISAYMDKNRLNSALEAETSQNMAFEAILAEDAEKISNGQFGQT